MGSFVQNRLQNWTKPSSVCTPGNFVLVPHLEQRIPLYEIHLIVTVYCSNIGMYVLFVRQFDEP